MCRKKWLLTGLLVVLLAVSGCGNKQEDDTSLKDEDMVQAPTRTENLVWSDNMLMLREAVAETLGDNYWPGKQLSQAGVEELFGIPDTMYVDYMAEISSEEEHKDMLLIFEAKEDYGNELEEILTKYHEKCLADQTLSAENAVKTQGSRIERIGEYVCYVQLGADLGDMSKNSLEEMIGQCREQNELAIAVLEQQLIH